MERIASMTSFSFVVRHLPRDWGGERSDLYTNHIQLKGVRKQAAFLLKGPAKFHAMTIKDLGANGDQINRLYEEDADIYILQQCHDIKPEIPEDWCLCRLCFAFFAPIGRFRLVAGLDLLVVYPAQFAVQDKLLGFIYPLAVLFDLGFDFFFRLGLLFGVFPLIVFIYAQNA